MSEPWVDKHRPESFDSIQGNNKKLKQIQKWAKNWSPGDSPQILWGLAGTGKTTTCHVLSNEMGWPLNEINASDARTTEEIEEIAKSMQSIPPTSDHQLILLDEVDSPSHSSNKSPIVEVLKDPRNPIVMTANEKWKIPDSFKRHSDLHKFKLNKSSIKAKLREVAKKEDLDFTDDDLERLSTRKGLRSALSDLQIWAEEDIPPGSDERTEDMSPFEVMDKIIKYGEEESGDMSPDDLVMWLDENLSDQFSGVEAAMAYDTLSRADKYLKRFRTDTKYWRYAGILGEQTGSLRLSEPYTGWLSWDSPGWFKSKTPKPESDTPEARVYRKLKDWDGGTYRFSGSFVYFRKVLLPILKELPFEERRQMCLENDLEPDEMKVLGVDKSKYSAWEEQSVPDDRKLEEEEVGVEDPLSF